MTDKTRQDKIDLLKSWKYTDQEWNMYALWQYVDYKSKAKNIKDCKIF